MTSSPPATRKQFAPPSKSKLPPRSRTSSKETTSPPSSESETDAEFGDFGEADSKICFPAPLVNQWRQRRGKIASTDVASVGNYSDTLVSVTFISDDSVDALETQRHRFSGRDLHESAKQCLNRGDYVQALDYFTAILDAQVSRFGHWHPSVGAAMHNVGVCRSRMQQHKEAAELFRSAVEIRTSTLGPSHIEVAASLSKLGTAQAASGDYDEAFATIRSALTISRRQLGHRHKTTAQMLCHLACFYFETGELFAAEATFGEAYDIYRAVWPNAEDRDACMQQMTDTLCNIGSVQNRRKKYTKAIITFTEAMDLQMGIMGVDHPRVVATMDNLAFAHSKNRDYASALSCYRKMFKAQVKKEFTPECFETFRKQVLMQEKLMQLAEAIEGARETLRLAKSMLGRDDKMLADIKAVLEDVKKKQRRSNPVAI